MLNTPNKHSILFNLPAIVKLYIIGSPLEAGGGVVYKTSSGRLRNVNLISQIFILVRGSFLEGLSRLSIEPLRVPT